MGQPASAGDDYLFDFDKLYASLTTKPFGELFFRQRVMGIDWAAQGNDSCVASILDRRSAKHFHLKEQLKWDEPNTTVSTGKIITLIAEYKPDVICLDIGGGGYNVFCDLVTAGIKNIYAFDGASTKNIGVRSLNMRADGYWLLKDWLEAGFLCIDDTHRPVLKQLEKIKQKWRTDGKRQLREKHEYKSEEGFSPDEADSLMMAVYGTRYLGEKKSNDSQEGENVIKRKSGSKRKR